ncbi:MAG: S41 family peptidase [Candidatus Paceibacterota bacterium]
MREQPDLIPPSIKYPERKNKSNITGISLALLLALGAFFSGYQVNNLFSLPSNSTQPAGIFSLFAAENNQPTEDIDLREFWKVWELLDEKFTNTGTTTVSTEDKINGAIKGLVSSYDDPYTVFLPPAISEQFNEDISGNFGGIGMEVGIRDGVVTVISPLPSTPAEKAGLAAGDLIVKIDGKSTEDMTIDEAVKLIRGEKGTDVILSIYREGATKIKDYTITRDTITIPTVDTELDGKVFTIKIYSFNAVAELKTQEALREFMETDATSLILDLRGNPGGYLDSAVSIASFFLPTGKVVVKENFGDNQSERLYRSHGRTFYDFNPSNFVVLVDKGSASASEILAGALKEHKYATVIGTDTFGKGSVQELVELPSGASLKVTIARWLTPEGHSISENGLKPDIFINRTAEQRMEEIDPQQKAAKDFLRGIKVESEKDELSD